MVESANAAAAMSTPTSMAWVLLRVIKTMTNAISQRSGRRWRGRSSAAGASGSGA
jgi:hypothetical protein